MDEILAQYLLEASQQDKMAALETAYSVHDSCIQLSHELHIRVFQEVVLGKVRLSWHCTDLNEWMKSQCVHV